MSYKKTIQYLFSQLPMYQRQGKAAYKSDLENTLALDTHFAHPHRKFKTIHVAGTNGKGSTSHLLASVLQESGYRVGLYTSPHLRDFRERVRVDGKMITEKAVVKFVEENKKIFEQIRPSFFEMTVAMAFDYFASEEVDVAVVEVGMGGRLDSTNIILPEISVITNIGFDHTDFLGNTYQKIAEEKAGIIKPKTPVIIGETQEATRQVFETIARHRNAPIIFADKDYKIEINKTKNKGFQSLLVKKNNDVIIKNLEIALLGNYQIKNAVTAICAIEILQKKGFVVNKNNILSGFRNVIKNTELAGRWQMLANKPLTIADTGHNKEGLTQILTQIKQTQFTNLHIVIGVVNDKQLSTILPLLPTNAKYYFTRASIPRALNEKILVAEASRFGLVGKSYSTVSEAFEAAKNTATPDDMIFVGGSTFVVAEVV